MNHDELTLRLADWWGLDVNALDEAKLGALRKDLAELVAIRCERTEDNVGSGGVGRMGFGIVKFKEQRFYSVKLGNLVRDRLGAAGLGGAALISGSTLAGLVATGTLAAWAGAGALAAILLALIGRTKPLVTSFGLDEATTLDLAWHESHVEHGFRLVTASALAARIGDVEAIYGNAGFTRAKLTNALKKLESIGMIKGAGGDTYQLIEELKVSDADHLLLTAGP
jgi:hypothetical protein